jgi:hypothetical protein
MTITVYPPYGAQSNPQFPSNESTTAASWEYQVARGKVAGATSINIFGYATGIDGTFCTIWDGAPTNYTFPTAATVVTISSSSASDNTSCRVYIDGLDSNWDVITEVVALNGTTTVTSTQSFWRINRFFLVSAGTGQKSNVGAITATINGTTAAKITATNGNMQNAWYSVPRNNKLYIQNLNVFSGDAANHGNVQAFGTFRAQPTYWDSTAGYNKVSRILAQTTFQAVLSIQRYNPNVYLGKTDIQWEATVNTGTASFSAIIEAGLIADSAP